MRIAGERQKREEARISEQWQEQFSGFQTDLMNAVFSLTSQVYGRLIQSLR